VGTQENDAVGRTRQDTIEHAKGVLKRLVVDVVGHKELQEQQAREEQREMTRRPAATLTAGEEEGTWEWDCSGTTRISTKA
jgi:hypothetical protein